MSDSPLRVWHDPSPDDVAEDPAELLEQLGRPGWIVQSGEDRSRTRAICTLLHGNEPSGLRALCVWLRSGEKPRVNCVYFVGAVEAALEQPHFTRRMRTGGRDLNRCFHGPFEDDEGRLARAVLDRLRDAGPEALLDLHNTSGSGPAYGVATRMTDAHAAMAAPFTDHVILTDLRLGTLIEAVEDDWPSLVVECGGVGDPVADAAALRGLRWFATSESVLIPNPSAAPIHVLAHPVRVELSPAHSVAYGEEPNAAAALTLRKDVDRHNFGVVDAGTRIGWVPERSLDVLEARCTQDRSWVEHFFRLEGDELILDRSLRLFMVTTNPSIARDDCLFYALSTDSEI